MQWFRYYHEALDDPKVQMLQPELFKHWVNILCVASRETLRGTLPVTKALAFQLRVDVETCNSILQELVSLGLLDERQDGRLEPHNWESRQPKSDDGAARVQKHRAKQQDGNVTRNVTDAPRVTPPDTDTESDTDKREVAAAPRQRTRKPVPRDELTEAIGRVWRPGRDWHSLTETEQKTCARASAELFKIGATPEMVDQARQAWGASRKWRDLTFTPDALKKHWGELLDISKPTNGIDESRYKRVEYADGSFVYVDR